MSAYHSVLTIGFAATWCLLLLLLLLPLPLPLLMAVVTSCSAKCLNMKCSYLLHLREIVFCMHLLTYLLIEVHSK